MSEQVPRNPYPGLRPFEQDDSEYFFGREAHMLELLRKLDSSRFVAVIGTSGSGKSSLVRAGLIPALYGDTLGDTGSHWRVTILRPGDNPFNALADELHETLPVGTVPLEPQFRRRMLETTLRRSSLGLIEAVGQAGMREKENLLVVVDQFEEIFRFDDLPSSAGSSDERAAFVKLLLEAASSKEARIYVLITMRSDFLGDCSRFRNLPEAINNGLYLIPRLTREQLREAIVGPMAVSGGKISSALVEKLLNDIGDDQDQLPVLQHALMRTWLPKREITLDDYKTKGGMETALSNHANEALQELQNISPRLSEVARKVFQCITEKGPDNREVRRPTRFEDLPKITGASEADVRTVIECFRAPGRSFLMPPSPEPLFTDTRIDISHESLIRKWDALRQWVNEESESADWYKRLAVSAQLHKEGREGLWGDPALQFTLEMRDKAEWNPEWGMRYAKDYDETMRFLGQSRQKRDAEAIARAEEAQRKIEQTLKEAKRARLFASVLASAFVLASILIFYLTWQSKVIQAKEQLNQRLLYVANMNLATIAFDDKNVSRGHELLSGYLPKTNDENRQDVRSFYWYYLWHQNHQELATLRGHVGSVLSVAFLPDSKTLASVSRDDTVTLWDVESRRALVTHRGYKHDVSSVALTSDGKMLATGSLDKKVTLWDVRTRKELAKFEGASMSPVAISSDGKMIATVISVYVTKKRRHVETRQGIIDEETASETVKLWDMTTQREVVTLKGHEDRLDSLAFSPDGKKLATGSGPRSVKLWDVASGEMLATLSDVASRQAFATVEGYYTHDVLSIAFSSDAKTLAAGSRDSTIKLWDLGTRQELATLKGHGGSVNSVAFSPDGKTLATGSGDATVKLWDVAARKELVTLKGHRGFVNSVVFSTDGKTLATGSQDGTVKLWNVRTRQDLALLKAHEGRVNSVAFSPDGKTLATGSGDATVKLWDVAARKELVTLKGHRGFVNSVAFSADGKTLASGSGEAYLALRGLATRQELAALTGRGGVVVSASISSDAKTLASESRDGTLILWDIATRQELAVLKNRGHTVNSVAFSPDGKTLATGSTDQAWVKLWEIGTQQELATLKGHAGSVDSVSFSSDEKTLAMGGSDDTIRLWDLKAWRELATLKGHGSRVNSVAFSPDGKTLATGSGDATVKLWDVATRRELATLKGHGGSVNSVVFSLDGKTLAAGSEDTTVKLWDVAARQELATLKGHQGFVKSVAFSPDGKTLATGSEDNTIRLWIGATEEQVAAQRP